MMAKLKCINNMLSPSHFTLGLDFISTSSFLPNITSPILFYIQAMILMIYNFLLYSHFMFMPNSLFLTI